MTSATTTSYEDPPKNSLFKNEECHAVYNDVIAIVSPIYLFIARAPTFAA